MKKVVFFCVIVAMVICIGCNGTSSLSATSGAVLGVLKETGRIKLKESGIFRSLIVKDGTVYGYDGSSKSIVVYAPDKKPLYYSRIGKGPGEWQENAFDLFGVTGSTIVAREEYLNKVMIFNYDKDKNTIEFVDEFLINEGVMNNAVLHSDGKIYVSLQAGKYEFAVYDLNGNLEKQCIPVNRSIEPFSEQGILDKMKFPIFCSNTLFTVNPLTYEIGKFTCSEKELTPNGNLTLNTIFNKKPWDINVSGTIVSAKLGMGISAVVKFNGKLLFMVCDSDENNVDFFQAYDDTGAFIGNYMVENGKKVLRYLGYDESGKVYYQLGKPGILKKIFQKTDEIVIGQFEAVKPDK